MANPTVVVSQGIEHFRYMTRLRYTTVGGAVSETVTIGDVTLSPTDFIRVLSDPNVNVLTTKIIEVKASRSQTNGTILLSSSDGTSNIPSGISLEILIIRRQTDGQSAGTPTGFGNAADSIWGHQDVTGSFSDFGHNFPHTVNVSSLLTLDSEIWVEQKSVIANVVGGYFEVYGSRVSGTSFAVHLADNNDSPANTSVAFDYAVLNH